MSDFTSAIACKAIRSPTAPSIRVEQVGNATLYCGNCIDLIGTLSRPSALISDPPYGMNYIHSGRGSGTTNKSNNLRFRRWSESVTGDSVPFNPAPYLAAADIVLLWGAHRFASRLPDGDWLVWDKVPTGKTRDQGDGETAWVNRAPRAVRIFRHLWDGVCVADRRDLEGGRQHPMQKPVALMQWCIQQAEVPVGGTVLDPFMGSGTTGIAALSLGHPFVGIEIDSRHFEVACRRIDAAQRQGRFL